MVRTSLCCAALLGMLAASPCQARDGDFASGQMLARACGSTAAGEKALCDGYIAGALDTVATNADMKANVCVPPNTKLSALRETVGHYAPGHVDETKGSGIALLAAAVKATYPCPGK